MTAQQGMWKQKEVGLSALGVKMMMGELQMIYAIWNDRSI